MTKFSSILFVLLLVLTSFSAHAQEYPRGDVNQDGAVNISDVTCLIDNLLSGVPEGDVNQDGVANISDVTSLIDYLLSGSWPDDPVTPPDLHEWVDLGLPSGTLWATCNVGANVPEECGDYFAWGETEPKDYYDWGTYKWCNGNYDTLTKYCTNSNYGYNGYVDNKMELDSEDDAAYVNWGSSWRMPTLEQQQELIDNCTTIWMTRNGVDGQLVTGPNGNTLFLPASGYRWNDSHNGVGDWGEYWSRTLDPDYTSGPYHLDIYSFGMYWDSSNRAVGLTVRAVRAPEEDLHEYVDLGLPSGTLWATCNVGASAPEEYGDYFAWGETEPKEKYTWETYQWCNGSDTTLTKYCTDSDWGYIDFTDGKIELDPEDDAAYVNWGSSWRIPTKEQLQELDDYCSSVWTTMNSVKGRLFTGPNGNTLFLPAAGRRWNESLYDAGFDGYCWSRTLYSNSPYIADNLSFYSEDVGLHHNTRNYGLNVRAVRVTQN